MTLIAYKDGIICADTQLNSDDMRGAAPIIKIARNRRGELFAASGSAAIAATWMKWFLDGCVESNIPCDRSNGDLITDVVIFSPTGASKRWLQKQNIAEWVSADRLGLGWPSYLHGLMDAGLSARDAVMVGVRRYTGADYPLIEIGHSGDPIVWEAPDRMMPLEAFEWRCGRQLSYYFHDPA